jgi:hypothetical protein
MPVFIHAEDDRATFQMITVRIPAKMTAHSGDRDRFAHRLGAGRVFLAEAVTISQG